MGNEVESCRQTRIDNLFSPFQQNVNDLHKKERRKKKSLFLSSKDVLSPSFSIKMSVSSGANSSPRDASHRINAALLMTVNSILFRLACGRKADRTL